MVRLLLRLTPFFIATALSTAALHPRIARAEQSAAQDDEASQDDDAKVEEEDRAFVAGDAEGSLKNPVRLTQESQAAQLCDDLMGPMRVSAAVKAKRRAALRDVFTVMVPPGGFKVGDYRPKKGVLPIRLESPLIALDGALSLVVVQRAGGAVPVPASEATALAAAIKDKRIGLEVTFRIDSEGGASMAPCFSYAKSAAYALNAEPLSYTFVEGEKRIATSKTPAATRLERWLAPGKASLEVAAHVDGGADPEALTRAIETKRSELESCAGPVLSSPSGTGIVSFDVTLTPDGSLGDPRVEAEAIANGPEVSACMRKVLAAVRGPKERTASRAHVTLSVERGDEDSEEVAD